MRCNSLSASPTEREVPRAVTRNRRRGSGNVELCDADHARVLFASVTGQATHSSQHAEARVLDGDGGPIRFEHAIDVPIYESRAMGVALGLGSAIGRSTA
jgi:hypothetical protein